MCLIVNRPANVEIPTDLLKSALSDNPHGWGIMRAKKGRLILSRGMDSGSFWETLSRSGNGALAIHFRWATHGTKDVANCHPFELCGGDYALMHNGIISSATIDPARSDTWHFGEYCLGPILRDKPEWFGTDHLASMLGSLIGKGNKLVIMRRDGATMTVNPDSGEEWDGLWLSNGNSVPGRKAWKYIGFSGTETRSYRTPSHSAWDRDEWLADRDDYATTYRASDSTRSGSISLALPDDTAPAKDDTGETTIEDLPRVFQLKDLAGWHHSDVVDWAWENPEEAATLAWDYLMDNPDETAEILWREANGY